MNSSFCKGGEGDRGGGEAGGGGGRGSGSRCHHPGGGVAKERQKDQVNMCRKRSHYLIFW